MQEEESSFEKSRLYLCHTFILSQHLLLIVKIFILGACFVKSALNSIDLFRGLPHGFQFKRSYLGSSVIGSSLGFSVIRSFLGSCVLGIPNNVSKYIY